MKYCIGIDIGGTKIAFGIVSEQGDVSQETIIPTPSKSKEKILQVIEQQVKELLNWAEENNYKLDGIGIGSAGQINSTNRIIVSGTDNIHNWNNVKMGDFLTFCFDLPVYLDNDVNTFAIAEHQLGAGKGIDNLVCLTLGTGIGGAVITNGSVLKGEWGGAAELGHITVNMFGPLCNCGSRGCIETYASGTGIANRMKEKMKDIDKADSQKLSFCQNLDTLTSRDVFKWKKQGVLVAEEVIADAIEALSYGIINMIHSFNPTMIILGGGITEGNSSLIENIRRRIHDLGIPSLVKPIKINTSSLGVNAGLIGAGLQVWMD